jgi:hypothetical protein
VRVRSVPYRRWDPPQSDLEVEFPADLLYALIPEAPAEEISGVLYGYRQGREIRVLSCSNPDGTLGIVGVFASRSRGEVFLTEADFHRFEASKAPVALVIAGDKAGFFAWEADGTIQCIRSHEEFSLQPAAAPPTPPAAAGAKPAVSMRRRFWPAAAAVVAAALPAAALAYLRPAPAPALLKVADERGQLHISWERGQRGNLEIDDAGRHVKIPVSAAQSSATFRRVGGEVEIRLNRERTRFLGPPPDSTPVEKLRSQIAALRTETRKLHAQASANLDHIARRESEIADLSRP